MKRFFFFLVLAAVLIVQPAPGAAGDIWQDVDLSKGQRVYAPVGHNTMTIPNTPAGTRNLVSLLIIRNVDIDSAITLTKIVFIGVDGKMEKNLLTAPVTLKARASSAAYSSGMGGVGLYDWMAGRPAFYVEWKSENGQPVVAPMIGVGMMIKDEYDDGQLSIGMNTVGSKVVAELQ